MAWSKEDKSFKSLINKRNTSNSKTFYEEFGDSTINVHKSDIWAEDVPSDPSIAVAAGIAERHELLALTEDSSVLGHQCYYAFSSGNRLKEWISDKFGDLYLVRLYSSDNVEIFPTNASDWIFDYQTGILIFNGSTAAFSKPFKITAYRYIGIKGALKGETGYGAQGETGLVGFTGSQGVSGIQGATGLIGLTGAQGVTGLIGSTGIQGVTGLIGSTGIQ